MHRNQRITCAASGILRLCAVVGLVLFALMAPATAAMAQSLQPGLTTVAASSTTVLAAPAGQTVSYLAAAPCTADQTASATGCTPVGGTGVPCVGGENPDATGCKALDNTLTNFFNVKPNFGITKIIPQGVVAVILAIVFFIGLGIIVGGLRDYVKATKQDNSTKSASKLMAIGAAFVIASLAFQIFPPIFDFIGDTI